MMVTSKQPRTQALFAVVVALLAAGCGADPSDVPRAAPATASTAAAVSETIDSTDTTDTTDTTSTTEFVPETTEPKLPIPEG
ncbi:MAG: hypothetical protein NTZ21_19550, partial [Actinobacteria bacterium]|nr:hypothetical protein [Actinomycetota bacterium]